MDLKRFFRESNTVFIIKMLLLAAVVTALIVWAVLFWLSRYTEHNIEVEVPDVCSMYLTEAEMLLSAQQLHIQVIDSTYSYKVPLGTIVEQNPPAGAKVKHGRSIYVITNAQSHRQVPLPDLHDLSYRQAEATLKAINLKVSEIQYEPSEYKDLVLDVRQNDSSLLAGTRLTEGASVVLVVGKGSGTEQVFVPDLTGKTIEEARKILLSVGLIIGATNYDQQPTPATEPDYRIYMQSPHKGEWLTEGSHVDLSLSTDTLKAQTVTIEEEEDFF